jgi:hypothetical protein
MAYGQEIWTRPTPSRADTNHTNLFFMSAVFIKLTVYQDVI